MNGSISLGRFVCTLVLGILVGATLVSVAWGVGRPPDVRDAAIVAVASQTPAVPDVFERYAAAHPYGVAGTVPATTDVGSPPDIRDTTEALLLASAVSPADRAPADIVDASSAPVVAASDSGGFNWSEYGAWIATGAVILALGAAAVLGGRYWHHHHPHHPQAA